MIANADNADLDSALNLAWRETVTHFITVRGWVSPVSEEEKDKIRDDMTFNKGRALRSLAPDTGAYFNEMDANEPDWQYAAFGENYPRLKAIKDKYDAEGVLWCSHCVGSEDWAEDRQGKLCRPKWWTGLNEL
ncbi:hypothetical protein IL306_005729 [Fusarium sp. DS 682]|nr:hypothetical protein IL306_005729 [Fusarium sp. DS 682]